MFNLKYCKSIFRLVFLACCVLAVNGYASTGQNPAKASETQKKLARLLEGEVIYEGNTIYRISHVYSIEVAEYGNTLRAEAIPLFELEFSPDNPGGILEDERYYRNMRIYSDARRYFNAHLSPEAKCGMRDAGATLHTGGFLVLHQGEFVTAKEAFGDFPFGPSYASIVRFSPGDLKKIDQCAKKIAAMVDAVPFRQIDVYAKKELITQTGRSLKKSFFFEDWPGDDLISTITHLTITGNESAEMADFNVDVHPISVMHCDYEGPHLELDDWKKGVGPATRLKQKGNIFYVDGKLSSEMPPFPVYTQKELRRAVAQSMGEEGLASDEEIKSCAPFFRGYRFSVYYRSRMVQEIFLAFPGGC